MAITWRSNGFSCGRLPGLFSDEDDGSFSDIELENQERDFHFDNELASSYDDPLDIIDVVNLTSSNNEGTSTGQSDQNIPQKLLKS